MIAAFTNWLFELFRSVFVGLWDFVTDIFVSIADAVFVAIAAGINSIPAPGFLTDYSLGSLLARLPDYVLYFVGALNIGQCFAVVGAGFAFRMLRKIFTLGQW
jgi:hypothetical protein